MNPSISTEFTRLRLQFESFIKGKTLFSGGYSDAYFCAGGPNQTFVGAWSRRSVVLPSMPLPSLSRRQLWWLAAITAFALGIVWVFCLLAVPFLIGILTDKPGAPKVFQVNQFVILTTLAIFSQSIIDKVGSLIKAAKGPAGDLEVFLDVLRRNIYMLALSLAGFVAVMFYFAMQEDNTFQVGSLLLESGFLVSLQALIVIIMLSIGTIHASEHPWFWPTSGEDVG